MHLLAVCDASPCAVQAEYHGIALTVNPDKLTPVNGKPLQQALERVLAEPVFKVRHAGH